MLATTEEEEEEEVVVMAGEDKEEAKDKVGGAVGTLTPSCKRFNYSRSIGATVPVPIRRRKPLA